MSDVYIPGVKSRFSSEKLIEDLMKIERVPKERAERNVENLQTQKSYWQEVGRRVNDLRESARQLYSFQNPFNERIVRSSDESVISASATREAGNLEYRFSVKQTAQADRFLSPPLDEKMHIESGTYTFSVGKEEFSVNFRGGSLKDLVDALNRRGQDKISASLIAVQSGTKSLLIESKITGAENRLGFSADATALMVGIGMIEQDAETDDQSVVFKPVNAVSAARDSIITMEGIEIARSTNTISDLIPGLTINVKGISDRPVELKVSTDNESIKEAIISFVGNYNRLMAEINILTAKSVYSGSGYKTSVDDAILNELTYLTADERTQMRSRLGAFSGDITLSSLKNSLQQTVSAPYPTSMERDLAMLVQIGISTNASNRGGGYEPSQMRGYLQIDEKVLDTALETKLQAVRQLFASDTTGDLIMNTGVAVNLDAVVKPVVDIGGIISLKTNTIDSRITQDQRRIDTMERQLAAKETELKNQYSRMEEAYSRMEQMSSSLDNFSQQNRNNR
ncbi:MAG: flagellar filament capping protein FliD [Treponema sp.]|jgi:flagellar capping protein FliD|nr:flagellar filament capping protein FliD [Treponema sp.]